MSDGHCRHCEDECPGGLPIPAWPHPEPHMNDDGAEWPEGKCPACAEAERVEAALLDEYDEHEDIAVLAALRIVRCER